jgi:hypothetical protein
VEQLMQALEAAIQKVMREVPTAGR